MTHRIDLIFGFIEGLFIFLIAGFSGIYQIGIVGVVSYFFLTSVGLAFLHSYVFRRREFPPEKRALLIFMAGFFIPLLGWQFIVMIAARNFTVL